MALPATDMGIKPFAAGMPAVGLHSNLLLDEREGPLQTRNQGHMLAGVGAQDVGDGAVNAKVPPPGKRRVGIQQQAAFFPLPPTVIVTVKIRALFAGWRSHWL